MGQGGLPGRGLRCGGCGKCRKCIAITKKMVKLNRKLDAQVKAKNEKTGRDGKK